jgi:hypothetical protein
MTDRAPLQIPRPAPAELVEEGITHARTDIPQRKEVRIADSFLESFKEELERRAALRGRD